MADPDDFKQQAWLEYLEHVKDRPSPEGVRRDVWETGVTIRRLWEWCRKWKRVLGREFTTPFRFSAEENTLDPADDSGEKSFSWVDAVDAADSLLEPREASLVYLRAAGMTFPQCAEELGVSVASVWQWAARIKKKVERRGE